MTLACLSADVEDVCNHTVSFFISTDAQSRSNICYFGHSNPFLID